MENLSIEKYLLLAYVIIKRRLVYKIDTIMLMSLQICGPIIMLFVWSAVYLASGVTSISNFTLVQITTYFFVVAAISAVSPGTSWGIISDVKVGNVFMYLTRPLSYVWVVITGALANFAMDATVVAIPILVILYVLTNALLSTPTLLLFVLSMFISFFLSLSFEFFLGYMSFFIVEVAGIINIFYFIVEFLGGGLIPLNLLPQGISSITSLLPFQFILYYPPAIFTHVISVSQAMSALPLAAFWFAVMLVLNIGIWYAAREHMDVVGV
ncbi:MAG: ABC transporter permease [Candidatus Micrarchaeales archaeon]